MKINIARIKRGSMVDGPGGPRTVVWLQGCSIRCPGCQNWALHPAETSDMMTLEPIEAARMVLALSAKEHPAQDITITGGEPFDQAAALGPFVAALGDQTTWAAPPHIIIYSGRKWEDLVRRATRMGGEDEAENVGTFLALDLADVLVDGQYMPHLDTPSIQWRGSSNQRAVDLRPTRNWHRASNKGGWMDETLLPLTLEEEWDTPTIEIVGGVLYGTGGLLEEMGLTEAGLTVERTPRCGQFKPLSSAFGGPQWLLRRDRISEGASHE